MAGKKMGKGESDFVITTPGRIQTPIKAFSGGITGTPEGVKAYANSDPPGTNKLPLRRPTGGKTGPGINNVAKKGKA